jgi:hypothetical protein
VFGWICPRSTAQNDSTLGIEKPLLINVVNIDVVAYNDLMDNVGGGIDLRSCAPDNI